MSHMEFIETAFSTVGCLSCCQPLLVFIEYLEMKGTPSYAHFHLSDDTKNKRQTYVHSFCDSGSFHLPNPFSRLCIAWSYERHQAECHAIALNSVFFLFLSLPPKYQKNSPNLKAPSASSDMTKFL